MEVDDAWSTPVINCRFHVHGVHDFLLFPRPCVISPTLTDLSKATLTYPALRTCPICVLAPAIPAFWTMNNYRLRSFLRHDFLLSGCHWSPLVVATHHTASLYSRSCVIAIWNTLRIPYEHPTNKPDTSRTQSPGIVGLADADLAKRN